MRPSIKRFLLQLADAAVSGVLDGIIIGSLIASIALFYACVRFSIH